MRTNFQYFIHRYRKTILVFILLLGFAFRYYAAKSVPINFDERKDYPSARQISLDLKNLNLPIVDKNNDGPISFKYLVRIGWYIFGDSLLGARLPFVILGTLSILIAYFFTKSASEINVALLASFLLSISQYHIGLTRYPESDGADFLALISLFLFYKAIKNSNKNLILLNGLIIGIGFWFKEYFIFFIPIFIVFLLLCPEYKSWLRSKYLWFSFLIAFCIIFPIVYLSIKFNIPRIAYFKDVISIGISINALGVYLGELILSMIRPFPKFFNYVASSRDPALPLETFVFGCVILIAVINSIRNKDKQPGIKLLLVCFLFYFAIFSFVRATQEINSVWSLQNMDWSCFSFIPGVILAAIMLVDFLRRHARSGSLLFGGLIIFMLIRAWDFITYPLSCQVPIRDYHIEAVQFGDVEEFMKAGENELAKDVLKRIYKVTNKKPLLKKRAVFMLAKILIDEGKFEESKKFMYYLLSQYPNDVGVLKLLDKFKTEHRIKK